MALLPWRRRRPAQRAIRDLVETVSARCAVLRRNGAALEAVEAAHARRDAKALQARLREAQALGLGNLPPIRAAADDLDRVHREERLARDLDAFVADPLRAGEDVPALLDAAEAVQPNALITTVPLEDAFLRRLLTLGVLARGLGALAGKVWRIGLMGYNARRENAALVCAALRDALDAQGYYRAPGLLYPSRQHSRSSFHGSA